MQPELRTPGEVDNGRWQAGLAPFERVAEAGSAARVVGGFAEDVPQQAVPGLGDPPAMALGATGSLRRDRPDVGHEAWRRREPTQVARLSHDRDGAQEADPTEGLQGPNEPDVGAGLGTLAQGCLGAGLPRGA